MSPAPLPSPEELTAQVDRFVRHVTSIVGDPLRAALAGRTLEGWSPPLAVALLGLLVRRARDSAGAADAVGAVSRALATGNVHAEHVAACLDAARSKADRLVEAILGSGRAPREYVAEEEQFVDRRLRALTLGERRALSRTRDSDWLARLAHDQDPRVIRELLRNPRCTEREAIIAASRRPTHADILESVLASRFGTNHRIRRAVANNPYAPVALAGRAMSTLTTAELEEVIQNPHVAEEVRRHARDLQRGRRPTPAERRARSTAPVAAPAHGTSAGDTSGSSLDDALTQLLERLEGDNASEPELVVLRPDGTPLG